MVEEPRKPSQREQLREGVSDLTTSRLSVYLRCLTQLEASGEKKISSQELARRFHLNSAQIRKDLACLGEFGIRGVGYDVALLKQQLVEALGIDRERAVVIIGAGNLGLALANYRGFNSDGFRIVALFDRDRSLEGKTSRNGIAIHHDSRLEEIVRTHQVEIAIVAVPAENAQTVYERVVDAGIRAVLNFAPVQIGGREGVKVRSVDLRINLESLSFYLSNVDLCSGEPA